MMIIIIIIMDLNDENNMDLKKLMPKRPIYKRLEYWIWSCTTIICMNFFCFSHVETV